MVKYMNTKTRKQKRRIERERALRAIFQINFQSEDDELRRGIQEVLEGDAGFPDADPTNGYAAALTDAVLDHLSEIDKTLSNYLRSDWNLERIPNAEKSILRLSAAEMIYLSMPKEIAINEAVELAKKYGGDDAPKYINGILNSLAKKELGTENNDTGN